MPPFDRIVPEHFLPAFNRAFADNIKEVEAIAGTRAKPSFENTIEAMERAGRRLDRVSGVFYNLAGTDTNAAIQAIERKIAPRFAKHHSRIYQDAKLFKRVDALMQAKDELGLSEEQARVLERYHRSFVRAGAGLGPKARERMAAIAERLATLGTRFNQNVLADEQAYLLVLETEDELAGLPEALRAAAARTAAERGHKGKHAISLARSSIEPFLQFSARRDLREQAYKAWRQRGANGGKTDNRKIVAEILALRAERARLLGLRDLRRGRAGVRHGQDAGGRAQAAAWRSGSPPRPAPREERADLDKAVLKEGGNFEVAGWDWRYYAEKVRKAKYDVDEAEVKPYLQLDNVIAAAFDCANRLFGVSFKERTDLPVYHPEVRCWEVVGKDGRHIGLFLGRLLRAALEALGRLDVGLAQGAQARRRGGAPDRRQRHELRQGRARRAGAAEHRRRPHAVPRVRPRPARAAVERDLPVRVGHQRGARLRGAALAALRALVHAPRGAEAVRAALQDRQAAAAIAAQEDQGGAQLQPGLRHGGVHRLGHRGPRPARAGGPGADSMSMPSRPRRWSGSAHRPRSACATASRTSSTSSAAMRRATTATCGRR